MQNFLLKVSVAILVLLQTRSAFAQALPTAPSGTIDPIETGKTILSYIFDGLMALGGGIAVVSLGVALIKSMAGRDFDSARIARVVIGGAGLAGISFLANLVLGNS